jgi:hypothetical protein
VTGSPKLDPVVMGVFTARKGKEILDEWMKRTLDSLTVLLSTRAVRRKLILGDIISGWSCFICEHAKLHPRWRFGLVLHDSTPLVV